MVHNSENSKKESKQHDPDEVAHYLDLRCLQIQLQSTLVISKSTWDSLKHFKISVLRPIRLAELKKIPNGQPNFTNEYVI